MPECEECGAHVSARFQRVFAPKIGGKAPTCVNCQSNAEAGHRPEDIERRRGSAAATGKYVTGRGGEST